MSRTDPRAGVASAAGARNELDALVARAVFEGRLAELIALACEAGLEYFPPDHVDPGAPPQRGVRAAIRAFGASKHSQEGSMGMEARPSSARRPIVAEPAVVPLSCVGRWIAWSADGTRILGVGETMDEAERLAAVAGEPEPILERPMAPHRP